MGVGAGVSEPEPEPEPDPDPVPYVEYGAEPYDPGMSSGVCDVYDPDPEQDPDPEPYGPEPCDPRMSSGVCEVAAVPERRHNDAVRRRQVRLGISHQPVGW